MRDDYSLLTPENVELHYDLAGVGSRLVAALIDYLAITVAYVLLILGGGLLIGFLARLIPATGTADQTVADVGLALLVLLAFFGWWGYFVLLELRWNGQTLGKRRLGLRVIRPGGQPITATASFVRNLLRIVDQVLLLGVLVMLLDPTSRRLGDFAAGTLVVREGSADRLLAVSPLEPTDVTAAPLAASAIANLGRLTPAHYSLLRDFFARRSRLPPNQAAALTGRLAEQFGRVLGVKPADRADSLAFLAALLRAYDLRHQHL